MPKQALPWAYYLTGAVVFFAAVERGTLSILSCFGVPLWIGIPLSFGMAFLFALTGYLKNVRPLGVE